MTARLLPSSQHTSALRLAFAALVVEVFRLNGDQLAVGNVLGAEVGLTSARWQVLGAISFSPTPLPVAHIARNMGLTRQAVQRSVDEMRSDDLVRLEPNPHHRRAMLVAMTERGEAAYRAASERHGRWVDDVMAGLCPADIEAASALLREIQRRTAIHDAADRVADQTEEP